MRILVVDDSEDNRELFRLVLEAKGYEVTVAEDGEGALGSAAQQLPDLILTDIMMPGMSGLDLITRVRSDFPRPPPIVAISGFPNMKQEAIDRGVELFLEKPIDPDDLVASIAECLDGRAGDVEGVAQRTRARRHEITLEAEQRLGVIRQSPGWPGRLHETSRWIGALLECDCVNIGIEGGKPLVTATSAPDRYQLRTGPAALLRSALDVLQGGSSLLIASNSARAAFGLSLHLAACPLRFREERIGVVCLLREEGDGFDTVDLRVLELIARIVSRGAFEGGDPLFARARLLATRPFGEIVGLLGERVAREYPMLLAVIRTRAPIGAQLDAGLVPTATLAALGTDQLGVLLSGRRTPDALRDELRALLQQIDGRFGTEGVVASLWQLPLPRAGGAALVDQLRDVLAERALGAEPGVTWVEQSVRLVPDRYPGP